MAARDDSNSIVRRELGLHVVNLESSSDTTYVSPRIARSGPSVSTDPEVSPKKKKGKNLRISEFHLKSRLSVLKI